VGGSRRSGAASIEAVTWTIRAGDFWVVGGGPGSGKSDLLATVAGLLRPLSGSLRLFGADRLEGSEDELAASRAEVGLVFENGGRPFQHLTVTENIALPLCYRENCRPLDVRDRLEGLLRFGGLESVAGRLPGRIPHHLRQRLGLVRALALRPALLLIDNPLPGYAPDETRWWREALRRLAAGDAVTGGKSMTLVVGCFDLRPWMDQGRQFAVLKQRRWLPLGDRAAVAHSEDPLVRELLSNDPHRN